MTSLNIQESIKRLSITEPIKNDKGQMCTGCRLFYLSDIFTSPVDGSYDTRCSWCRGYRLQWCMVCRKFLKANLFRVKTNQQHNECIRCVGKRGLRCVSCGVLYLGDPQMNFEYGEDGTPFMSCIHCVSGLTGGQSSKTLPRSRYRSPKNAKKANPPVPRIPYVSPATASSNELNIIFGTNPAIRAKITNDDIWFNSPYPPSLEVVFTLMQLRYVLLEEEIVTGIYIQKQSERLLVCSGTKGGEAAWDIIANSILSCGSCFRVRVETVSIALTYYASVTKYEVEIGGVYSTL